MKTYSIVLRGATVATLGMLVVAPACSLFGGGKANKPTAENEPASSAESEGKDTDGGGAQTPTKLSCGDTTCDPATEMCSDKDTCIARAYNQPMRCGEQECTKSKPLCARDDNAKGGWACVATDDSTMFKSECLTKDNCAEGQVCCKGMSSRCVEEEDCTGGDTPIIACAVLADCPDVWYASKVKACEAVEDDIPGIKVCR